MLFFPEGTFTAATGLRPFRLGAFKTAVEAGVPVVPMALRGTRHVLRDGAPWPRPGRVRLWVGAPVKAGRDGLERDRGACATAWPHAIAAHCGEPRLDLVAAGPERPAFS